MHQTQSSNILQRIFILKKLHHVQEKLHAKLNIFHQITKLIHHIFFFTKSEKFHMKH